MLSRVADSLYWMSRYLERAEHSARLLDVTLSQGLDQAPESAGPRWDRLLASLRQAPPAERRHDPRAITDSLTFDLDNPSSIGACITAARENAQQVREQISSEMWEQLNRLYLQVRRANLDDIWDTELHPFFQMIKEGSHLFQGITDATMSHGEGWQFIQVGRQLERAGATAALLDVYLGEPTQQTAEAFDYLEWVGLLKSCTAFEAYCKVYTADVQPSRIAEFLLLDANFPRSVRFAADTIQGALHAIGRLTGARQAGRAERLAGRLRAALDYAQVDEIMADSLRAYLATIQRQCSHIHTAINQIYITYPIDTALAS